MQQGHQLCCLQLSVGSVLFASVACGGLADRHHMFRTPPCLPGRHLQLETNVCVVGIVRLALPNLSVDIYTPSGQTQLLHLLTTYMILLLTLCATLFAQHCAFCSAAIIRHCRTTIMQL
jgi:hypothetical protein